MKELDRFKANILVVKRGPTTLGIFVNVNLPESCLDDGSLDDKLQLIQEVVGSEFGREIAEQKLRYSISAAYILTNNRTGQEQLWVGNFQPRGNVDNNLRQFDLYRSTSFNQEVRQATRADYVRATLTRVGDDTQWTFGRLLSAVINFQAVCDRHHVFSNRLLDANAISRLRRSRAITHVRYFD